MFIGSENQFRNLFVMNAYKAVTKAGNAGDLHLEKNNAKTHMYLQAKDANNVLRSDLIDIKNIISINATSSSDMYSYLKEATITLNEDPVVGQDYIMHITVNNYVALGDDTSLIKFGAVHAVKGMTKSDFYVAMAKSLARSLYREATPLVDVILEKTTTTSGETPTTSTEDVYVLNNGELNTIEDGTYTAIKIMEVMQPWRRGVSPVEPVNFVVDCGTILSDGEDVVWGTVEVNPTKSFYQNGRKIADMEWFYSSTKGDMYKEYAYPDNFEFTPLVDASEGYHVLDIHFAYVGPGVETTKSEKTITVVCAVTAEMNKLIADIKTATGLNVSTVS